MKERQKTVCKDVVLAFKVEFQGPIRMVLIERQEHVCKDVPEAREDDGEEAALLLKFGEEVGKRGDERRLRLEFMEVEVEEEAAAAAAAAAADTQQAPSSWGTVCLVQCPPALLSVFIRGVFDWPER